MVHEYSPPTYLTMYRVPHQYAHRFIVLWFCSYILSSLWLRDLRGMCLIIDVLHLNNEDSELKCYHWGAVRDIFGFWYLRKCHITCLLSRTADMSPGSWYDSNKLGDLRGRRFMAVRPSFSRNQFTQAFDYSMHVPNTCKTKYTFTCLITNQTKFLSIIVISSIPYETHGAYCKSSHR